MDKTVNIAIVGVGGQGILLASEVISLAAVISGYDVKKSEVHGMAQRGGSVISEVRYGKKVFSPLIPYGEADFLISFEALEAVRNADMLAPEGTALINTQTIMPVTVSSGQQPWIDDLDERIERAFQKKLLIDALNSARAAGNIRTVNMVMTGALSKLIEISDDAWRQAMQEIIPSRHLEVNLRAFEAGREAASAL